MLLKITKTYAEIQTCDKNLRIAHIETETNRFFVAKQISANLEKVLSVLLEATNKFFLQSNKINVMKNNLWIMNKTKISYTMECAHKLLNRIMVHHKLGPQINYVNITINVTNN